MGVQLLSAALFTFADNDNSLATALFVLFLVALGAFVYFIPSIVARGKNRANAIFVLNLCLWHYR